MSARFRLAVAAVASAVCLVGVTGPAQADPTSVTFVTVTPSVADVSTGFATVVVDVGLQDPQGLPDLIEPAGPEPWPAYAVTAYQVGAPTAAPRPGYIGWASLRRVSGTPQDGVWRGSVEVSPAWVGDYRIDGVLVEDPVPFTDVAPIPITPVTVSVAGPQRWDVRPHTSLVRVVTGAELWTPRATVVYRDTGTPVGGAQVTRHSFWREWMGYARATSAPGVTVGPDGVWTGTPVRALDAVVDSDSAAAYGRRGTRGWSLEAVACIAPTIKYQASSRYSALALAPRQTLTVSGNYFPAAAVSLRYPTVHLQRLGPDGTWRTVATSPGRLNGRYTVVWATDRPGAHPLRIRIPGAADVCGGYAGTNLAAVTVRVG